MLACQRDLFDIPPDVTYLNAAAMSPLPKAGLLAGAAGAAAKGHPWEMSMAALTPQIERARAAAASLIGATADDIALTGSTSYGIATAGLNLKVPPGQRILILQGEHSSQVLEWLHRAAEAGAVGEVTLEIIPQERVVRSPPHLDLLHPTEIIAAMAIMAAVGLTSV